MADLRVGLVGFGLAGRVFHAPLVAATDGLRLAAVVTSRREEVAAAHPGAEVLGDVDGIWALSDVVVVAAPNRVHASIAREAVSRGVPVVVDKPLAVDAADAAALAREAESRGTPLTVFHNRRWDADFLTLRRLAGEGALGTVTRFESRFERFRPEVNAVRWRERSERAEGGGVLLDLGPHLVDQALVLFGPVERVYAEVGCSRPGAAVDDDAFLALEHENGVHSHLWASLAAPLNGPRFRVSGLRAGFAVDGLDAQETQLGAGMSPAAEDFGRDERSGMLVDEEGATAVPLDRGDYRAFYATLGRWIRGGGEPPVPAADAVAGLRILDAARLSAAERRMVDVAGAAPG